MGDLQFCSRAINYFRRVVILRHVSCSVSTSHGMSVLVPCLHITTLLLAPDKNYHFHRKNDDILTDSCKSTMDSLRVSIGIENSPMSV